MMGKNKLINGVPIEKMSREADSVEVMYVATTKEDENQADVSGCCLGW